MPAFQDHSETERDKRFLLSLSDNERAFLHQEAKKRGIHVAVLVRRCIRMCLMEKPDLFQIMQ